MAGSIIQMPNNGDPDWSSFVTIVEKTIRGYMGISMSNLAGSAAPAIQDGSVIEINGSVYQFTTAETITGWPSAAGTTEYIAAVPAGSTVTVIYTTTAPSWSGAKGGWYSGNNRYIGAVEWGGSATYADKYIYQRFNDGNNNILISGDGGIKNETTGFLKNKKIELGEWNMNGTPIHYINHGLNYANIYRGHAIVVTDAGNVRVVFIGPSGYISINATQIFLTRTSGGMFDTALYDGTASTIPNRGHVWVEYV